MDFNFKRESPGKMPPYFNPDFRRSFSTSSGVKFSPFMGNKMPKNPLINFISDLQRQNSENKLYKSLSVPGMSSPFSNPGSMSVSCFVSGIVGTDSQVQPTQESSSGLYFDMCLLKNAFSASVSEKPNLTCTDIEPTIKRTYAEVTKEIPESHFLANCSTPTRCDNLMNKMMISSKPPGERAVSPPLNSSTSSDSSVESCESQNRSFSESSADSDDSFIVFEYDVGTSYDCSDEDGNPDESEVICQTPESQEDTATLTECVDGTDSDSSEEENAFDEVDWLTPDDVATPTETFDEATNSDCSEDGKSDEENCQSRKKTKKRPTKTVTFKLSVEVFVIIDDGENESRGGPWEEHARDRVRFERRIQDLEPVISKILEPSHRENIYKNRFMTA